MFIQTDAEFSRSNSTASKWILGRAHELTVIADDLPADALVEDLSFSRCLVPLPIALAGSVL